MAYPTPVRIESSNDLSNNSSRFDAVILVSPKAQLESYAPIDNALKNAQKVDRRIGNDHVLIHCSEIAGGRLIHAFTGNLDKDYDDVRNFGDAAKAGLQIAKNAGAINPAIIVDQVPQTNDYQHALELAYLGSCQGLWQPLEARQALGEEEIESVKTIGLFDPDSKVDLQYLSAAEAGRRLGRDLCGTEPERMAPIGFANYCVEAFSGSEVKVNVIDDRERFAKDFPLFDAVARASYSVERHHPRIIELEYQSDGPIEKTLMIVGKAVTYDTGGADLKTGGHMAGMSRDKGGGAAVAGFMKTLAEFKPKGIKVVAKIAAVRNSIGTDAYVADEIITGHSGKRVRIGNTDAEGRLAMVDSLSHFRAQAVNEVNPQLFTVATLTGHALLSVGPYTALVENGPARQANLSDHIAQSGDLWGDGCDISRSRREDWDIIRPRTKADDVLSSNNGPSATTKRGHQFPMAFLSLASGLDNHGNNSEKPVPYVHVDIAGSGVESGDWQHDKPTAAPILALAGTYLR
ncbi:M17 family metallopeptidase [Aliikangiella coralliicola]|uniref:Leucyl aminopeptidase family protein n=1 Tax=Aliikangiella coralliicola TaxID=2592383 RepID=A0A545U625_9GAMM|nr:leucyl aminopeptidase family protein [Aliikangiella coralliicola]TQV84930.1 leucyl aminopeptidase family protein [Aliikangiella coralliicola]